MAIEHLMSKGFSFVCAHCVKLHIGLKRGELHCGFALKGRDCGGPIAGLTFPQYEGILDMKGAKFCFRCGRESTELVEVKGKGFVGVCREHVKMLETMVPVVPPREKTA